MITDPWVVWSFEHDAYWKPNRVGYTQHVLEAGVYTKEEAHEIEAKAEPGNELALHLYIVLDVAAGPNGRPLGNTEHRFLPVASVGHQLSVMVRNNYTGTRPLSDLTPEWCVEAFYRVNPGAKFHALPSLYLVDFAREVVRHLENPSVAV